MNQRRSITKKCSTKPTMSTKKRRKKSTGKSKSKSKKKKSEDSDSESDEEEVEKCSNFLKKGWVFYPLGMLLPLPDDIVTVLSGTARFNFWFVFVCSLFTRAVDISISVWGFGLLTQYWWGWIILGVGIVILGLLTYFFFRWQKIKEK